MPIQRPFARVLLFALVFASGASGLIYEVVWHRYLATLLGAQARATALVLAVFLGGISAGYFVFGRWSRQTRYPLLKVYAGIEVGLAVWGFSFAWMYAASSKIAGVLYGTFGISSLATDLLLSVALIGLPTFLMGGTLPVLTQGIGDRGVDASRSHARIYGWNTVGGCLGCLLAGYILIPTWGLANASRLASGINLLIAGVVWAAFIFRKSVSPAATKAEPTAAGSGTLTPPQRQALIAVGFISGFVLITLQTVLIRLAGLATGASGYAFTLIVSIYVLALGTGSLVADRFAHYTHRNLIHNLLLLSVLFTGLYFAGDYWSYGAHYLRVLVRDNGPSFVLYQALLATACAAMLMVPLSVAGLTLPLCFHLLHDDDQSLGHRVGQLYGANAIGCVLGALVGGYLLLEWFNLDQIFKGTLFLWIAAAVGTAYAFGEFDRNHLRSRYVVSFATLGLFAFCTAWMVPLYHKERFLQPFRYPNPTDATFLGAQAFGDYLSRSTKLHSWNDGPNTSVGIGVSKFRDQEISRNIVINGKSDGDTRGDLFTVQLLAHLPGLLAPEIKRACVIGFGTGITAGVMARYKENERVDVLEISGTVIQKAGEFDRYNYAASKNPKVQFHEMDAFRFFAGSHDTYDLIVSEPSNPWVSGIENLYTDEFYSSAIRKLTPTGLFVQWIHTYSFSDDLLRLVLRTMQHSFAYVSVFQLKSGDIALVASSHPIGMDSVSHGMERIRNDLPVQHAMLEAGIKSFEVILALEAFTPEMARAVAGPGPIHTLERPLLSQPAARAFFASDSARLTRLRKSIPKYLPMLERTLLAAYLDGKPMDADIFRSITGTFCDNFLSKSRTMCQEVIAYGRLTQDVAAAEASYGDFAASRDVASLNRVTGTAKVFTEADLERLHRTFESYRDVASALVHVPPRAFLQDIQSCLGRVESRTELYGECLLQKVILLEAFEPQSKTLKESVRAYLDWFPKLSSNSKNYKKLLEAKNILSSMN